MRTLIATLIALMLFATTPVVAGDWEDGAAAYDAGDKQKAFRLWKPLAEQGNVNAQFMLGTMYAYGWGVPQDNAKAVHWWTKGAKGGNLLAQWLLSNMYKEGTGVPQDYMRAYAWASITVAQGLSLAKDDKKSVAKHMAPAQIAEAQKLSRELWKKYVVPFQKK